MRAFINNFYSRVLSETTQRKSERIALFIAIGSFVLHLLLILLVDLGVIHLEKPSGLLKNPIAAIYTPFSFILVYEVYLLVYYLPRSFTTYIGKQYEIIVLIIIRRLFKDFAGLSITPDWFKSPGDLQFTYDLMSSLLLFFLIYLFNRQNKSNYIAPEYDERKLQGMARYIHIKKIIAASLVPVLLFLSLYSLTTWLDASIRAAGAEDSFKNINNVFFEQFFAILIVVDVILLLFSFFHTDEFHKVIRNSGFVISTILIRLSFSAHGLMNNLLIISAIVFGLFILFIHNKFQDHLDAESARVKP
ncbi:MAG: hypothetical protein KJS92_00380 [Bacteroidetes bacterium]|nr:hypothetical protein [Bacteroidota bacterium]